MTATEIPHDHDQCEALLLTLRPSQRICKITDDGSHGKATHARPGVLDLIIPSMPSGAVSPYCDECFAEIYGAHDCEKLGCPNRPCKDSERMPAEES